MKFENKLCQDLKDLEKIEKIILKCFGKHGKSALIQSRADSDSSSSSFILTNDCMTILSTIQLRNNQLFTTISKQISKNSTIYADNSKSLFIYILTTLKSILTPEYNQTNLEQIELIKSSFRVKNLSSLFEIFLNEWKLNENLTEIENLQDFLRFLPKLGAIYNLDTFNSNLSSISIGLVLDTLKFYLNQSIEFASTLNVLRQLLTDFEHILFYSDKLELEKSKLYKNGFLLDSRFNLNYIKNNSITKSIFLINQVENSNFKIEIKANLISSLNQIRNSEKSTHFSSKFLDELKSGQINLVFAEGPLNDLKKSQLSSINCSLINYLSRERIDFLCSRLNIEPAEPDSEIDEKKHVLLIDKIESVFGKESLNFFTCCEKKLVNILFCSPLKINFKNFRIYFHKCLKSLICLFDGSGLGLKNKIVKSSLFELTSIRVCKNIELKLIKNGELQDVPMVRFLMGLFQILVFKFENFQSLKDLHSFESTSLEKCDVYEPFNIKINCVYQCLSFVQSILKVDCICNVKSLSLLKSDHEDDDD